MRRSLKMAIATMTAVATVGMAAPAAQADMIDANLYPDRGHVHLDPVTTKIVANDAFGHAAAGAQQVVLNTVGPSMTVAMLGVATTTSTEHARKAAKYPGASVDVYWTKHPDYVKTMTYINRHR